MYQYGDTPREEVLRAIPKDGMVIGSIGCATGATEAVLVSAGREVHGVDLDPRAIELAKTRLTSARVVAPGEDPFEPASLDGLILADVIEHIPRAWKALAQFARAVRPGGWVFISVPNMLYWQALLEVVRTLDWPERPVGIFDETHLQVMTKRRLERWCHAAALRPEKWFDRYQRGSRIDRWTFGLFHQFFMYQLLVVCRREAAEPLPPPMPSEPPKY